MKQVHLADRDGNLKKKYVGFSFAYCFLGPIYLLINGRILSMFILLLFYYYFLPIPGMEYISAILTYYMPENVSIFINSFLMFFRLEYIKYIGISVVALIQIITSFFIEGKLLRKAIKKHNYLPITEDDARLLISINACNRNIPLADTRLNNKNNSIDGVTFLYNMQKDVPYILKNKNNSEVARFKEAEKKRKLLELNELYKLGQMKREEFEVNRAYIIKTYK